jgi:uncharacterized protein (DUF1697 family)
MFASSSTAVHFAYLTAIGNLEISRSLLRLPNSSNFHPFAPSSMLLAAMSSVVFLRAVNVGGTNLCRPAQLAKQLGKFDIVNIGAVGTFVVREDVSESTLRKEIAVQLAKAFGVKCEIMICSAKEIVDLVRQWTDSQWRVKEDPPRGERGDDIDAHVTIMKQRPPKILKLPIYLPSPDKWEIKIANMIGRAVICLRRRIKNGRLYPNAVVEKQFGIAATTRSWNTIEKVAKILNNENRSEQRKQNLH